MSDEIAYATIAELGARYRKRDLSPVEVTQALLARIEKLDPILHAFVTLTADSALAEARSAEEALRRGDARPLLGIPRSEEQTSELQSPDHLVCCLLLEKQ